MQGRRAADHPQKPAAHPEPPLVDRRRRLDLEPPVFEVGHGGVELERHRLAGGLEIALHAPRSVTGITDAGRREAHLRVLGDGEEVGRAQMLVPLGVPGVEAVGVDRQLDPRAVRPELVRAAEVVEVAADGEQAPEGLHREVDRRPVGVGRPARRRRRPLVVCRGGARPRAMAGGGGIGHGRSVGVGCVSGRHPVCVIASSGPRVLHRAPLDTGGPAHETRAALGRERERRRESDASRRSREPNDDRSPRVSRRWVPPDTERRSTEMFQNVVVGVKDDEAGRDALALARHLLSPGGSLTPASVSVAVLEPPPAGRSGCRRAPVVAARGTWRRRSRRVPRTRVRRSPGSAASPPPRRPATRSRARPLRRIRRPRHRQPVTPGMRLDRTAGPRRHRATPPAAVVVGRGGCRRVGALGRRRRLCRLSCRSGVGRPAPSFGPMAQSRCPEPSVDGAQDTSKTADYQGLPRMGAAGFEPATSRV